MKLTRNTLKELIRQSIKEIDFEDEEAFKKYQSQHKMRPSTTVNIGGKDTTVGQASGEEGGDEEGGGLTPEDASYDVDKVENSIDWEGEPDTDQFHDLVDVLEKESELTDGSSISSGDLNNIKGWIDLYDAAREEGDPGKIKGALNGIKYNADKRKPPEFRESVHESVRKPRKTTVKEVKKWFRTLEENRYKKTYASDARRVSWLVNNNLSEDYEAMPISMRKKWPKAGYCLK